jgi:hypothetical protein
VEDVDALKTDISIFISLDFHKPESGEQTYQQGTNQPKDPTNKRSRLHNPPVNTPAQMILPVPLENTSAPILRDPILKNAKGSEVGKGRDEV